MFDVRWLIDILNKLFSDKVPHISVPLMWSQLKWFKITNVFLTYFKKMIEEKSQNSEKVSEMDSKLKQNGYRTPESVRRKRTPRMLRGNYFYNDLWRH